MAAFPDWISSLLSAIGAPITAANEEFLAAWQVAEGGTASYNPLNTTQNAPGASPYNTFYDANGGGPYHVYNYGSPSQGAAATAQTLQNGNYPNLLAALQSGNPMAFLQSIGQELQTWGTGSAFLKGLSGVLPGLGPGAAIAGSITGKNVITGQKSSGLDPISQTVSTILVMVAAFGLLIVGGIWLANTTGVGKQALQVTTGVVKKGAEAALA